VALTFDDGPDPRWTPVVLEILDRYHVQATFFVLGFRAEPHPELIRAIVDAGHSLQHHTYGHEYLVALGDRWVDWTLDEGTRVIADASGTVPTCLRPPYGVVDDRVERLAREHGLEVVLWDVDSGDYAHGSPAAALRTLATAQPGDVIVMHDIHGWVWAEALGPAIEQLRARGIGFDTLCVPRPPRPVQVLPAGAHWD
jgi:peptidoglycan/xylan/chitin deacetylase (PgdA/CDA1 family)